MFVATALVCGMYLVNDQDFPIGFPPKHIEELLRSVSDAKRSAAEWGKWLADPVARPFLTGVVLEEGKLSRELMSAYRDAYWTKDEKRRERWLKEGRVDLVAEAASLVGRAEPEVAAEVWTAFRSIPSAVVNDRLPAVLKDRNVVIKDSSRDDLNFHKKIEEDLLKQYEGRRPSYHKAVGRATLQVSDARIGYLGWQLAGFADHMELFGGMRDNSLFVASAGIEHKSARERALEMVKSLTLCNGPVSIPALAEFIGSVLIADGDVTTEKLNCWQSLIIARGDIVVEELDIEQGVLIAGGRVVVKGKGVKNEGVVAAAKGFELATKEGMPGPHTDKAGPRDVGIRWFELADVGLEVTAGEKRPVVKSVAEKSPLRGWLREKDELRMVNETPVKSAEDVRRALRRAVVQGYVVVAYVRDGGWRTKLIPVPDVLPE